MADLSGQALGALLRDARRALDEAGIDNAALDARLIVEHFSQTSRIDAITTPDRLIAADAALRVTQGIARRIAGEPVHRILGFREFYGLRLALSPETLEPRPDTETLVEALLPFVRATADTQGTCRILDLGTGTGAIALALLSQAPRAVATGVDISRDALETATANAEALGLGARFTPLLSDWFSNVSGFFHAIAANPPYITSEDMMSLQAEVRNFDPARALDGGVDGLDAYRTIAQGASMHLEQDGVLGVEIGHSQKADVTTVFRAEGFALVEARNDLAGRDRVLVFRRN